MTFDDLVQECIAIKQGNKEFSLYYHVMTDRNVWSASIGNESTHVLIGEGEAQFSATGETIREAVESLLDILKEKYK